MHVRSHGWCHDYLMYYSEASRLRGLPACLDKLKVVAQLCEASSPRSQSKDGTGESPPLP